MSSDPPLLRERFLNHFLECECAVRGFIATVTARPSDREDILQEVAIRLWQLYDRYDAARPFTPWALGVAARTMKEECRKSVRRAALLDAASIGRMAIAFEQIVDEESGEDAQAALAECLAALPESSAMLIRDRYFSHRSIGDLASASGQSAGAVYQTLCRLRRRLAECIRLRLGPKHSTNYRHAERS